MKKIIVISFFLLTLLSFSPPIEARRSSGYSNRSYSSPSYKREYKYIIPRNQIPIPKSESVRPYFRKDGTYVPGYKRAPYSSLRPYYAPGYPKYKFRY